MKNLSSLYLCWNAKTSPCVMLMLVVLLHLVSHSDANININSSESSNVSKIDDGIYSISNQTNSTLCLKKRSFWKQNNAGFTAIYITIFVIGLAVNIMLLFIFSRHRELRTFQNVTFVSVALADIIFLIVHVGIFRFSQLFQLPSRPSAQSHFGCHFYAFCSALSCGTNAYTVAAISIQRYFGIVKFSNPRVDNLRVSLARPIVLLSAVWVISCILAVPFTLVTEICDKRLKCFTKHLFPNGISPFITYGLLPTAIIVGFYLAAPRNVPETVNRPVVRTAKVLLAFSIVYALTFLPPLMCNIYLGTLQQPVAYDEPVVLHWLIANVFFHLNPVLNPLALCLASVKLRGYFSHYLLYCCKSGTDPGQWITFRTNSLTVRTTRPEDG